MKVCENKKQNGISTFALSCHSNGVLRWNRSGRRCSCCMWGMISLTWVTSVDVIHIQSIFQRVRRWTTDCHWFVISTFLLPKSCFFFKQTIPPSWRKLYQPDPISCRQDAFDTAGHLHNQRFGVSQWKGTHRKAYPPKHHHHPWPGWVVG